MSARYVFPELFNVTTQTVRVGEKNRIGLRWIINPSIGLPRSVFKVWKLEGRIPPQRTSVNISPVTDVEKLVSWPDGPAAIVSLGITVSGGTATINAYSAPLGAGHLVDQKTIVGPISSVFITLSGCTIASIVLKGNASIQTMTLITAQDFVNHPGWKLIEEAGLPVTSPLFDTTGYPLTPQGEVAAMVDPVKAAMTRVKNGTPDEGWNMITDRGTTTPAFIKPDPETLVNKEISFLMESVAQLLKEVADPAGHANHDIKIITSAPSSIHNVEASAAWQTRAKPATVKPLASLLVTAGLEPYAALALGFGTTIDEVTQQVGLSAASAAGNAGVFMVTVNHKITQNIKLFPFLPEVSFTIEGELAAFCFRQKSFNVINPQSVAVLTSGQQKVDPPAFQDGPWLYPFHLGWLRESVPIAWMARPTGYAVASQMPGKPLEMRIEERLSGGWISFTPALSPDNDQPASVRFTDQAVPEPLPGEPAGQVYSVAAHDWFGRWSAWMSSDNTRSNVASQITALLKVDLSVDDIQIPLRPAQASVEFSWDWTNRSPLKVILRVLVYEDGSPAPATAGSIYSVAGPVSPDQEIDFSTATKEDPPAGVVLIPDESSEEIKKYKVSISGITINYSNNERTRITLRVQGIERFNPLKRSLWSRDVDAVAISPIPPPPPFVPSAMWWSSIPDPKGVSRTTLTWASTGPKYAIYVADETALLRELNLPSADLQTPAAQRLINLRSINIQQARRAFRKIADHLKATEFKTELPRGSRLIHFYSIVAISNAGVEGALPVQANDYIAVASPNIEVPETPDVIARFKAGKIKLAIEVPETKVRVSRIEVYCSRSRVNTTSVESMGPPIMILNESDGSRNVDSISWETDDNNSYPPWRPVFYRVIAWGKTDLINGIYGGQSLPSGTAEVTIESAIPPTISMVLLENNGLAPGFKLLSFDTDASLARTSRGAHHISVKTYDDAMRFKIRSVSADKLPLIKPDLPLPDTQPDSIFRFDPVQPLAGRTYAWIDDNIKSVIIEIKDPLGRVTTATKEV